MSSWHDNNNGSNIWHDDKNYNKNARFDHKEPARQWHVHVASNDDRKDSGAKWARTGEVDGQKWTTEADNSKAAGSNGSQPHTSLPGAPKHMLVTTVSLPVLKNCEALEKDDVLTVQYAEDEEEC